MAAGRARENKGRESVLEVRDDIRNLAIIAHVDHGKTTLVDAMLWQSGIFREHQKVQEQVMDSIDLDAREDQIDFPLAFTNAKLGLAKRHLEDEARDLRPLFETILARIPPPQFDPSQNLQLLITNIDYNDYVGRMAVGRISNGSIFQGGLVSLCRQNGNREPLKVTQLNVFEGLKRVEVKEATARDIVCVAGSDTLTIGETIADADQPHPLPSLKIDEPTLSMIFSANISPFSGREGKYVTSRHLKERLEKELLRNVSLRVEPTEL